MVESLYVGIYPAIANNKQLSICYFTWQLGWSISLPATRMKIRLVVNALARSSTHTHLWDFFGHNLVQEMIKVGAFPRVLIEVGFEEAEYCQQRRHVLAQRVHASRQRAIFTG